MQAPINRASNEPVQSPVQNRISGEAFLRRAALLDAPDFMLKGSYVGRHYFADPEMRHPNDLDWVFLTPCKDADSARRRFSEWVNAVTAIELDDGVVFGRFHEVAYWHMFDYAMAADFPTVKTWLRGLCDRIPIKLNLDVSLNLDLPIAPQPLHYTPVQGESFCLSKTVSLPLQIAWKLHQCLVRPRLKDVFDLRHMLYHPSFDLSARDLCLTALRRECEVSRIASDRVDAFLLRPWTCVLDQWSWQRWRSPQHNFGIEGTARAITDASAVPERLEEFLNDYRQALIHSGLISADAAGVEPLPPTNEANHHVVSLDHPLNTPLTFQTQSLRQPASFWKKLMSWMR
jgi:hypothetical protein